jgi:hypothetical protein
MQRNSNGRTEPEKTTETALGRCLVEGDAATKVRDRRRRREALGISFAVEFVLLALLIAAPLMNSVAQPHFNAVSFMPIAFGGSHKPHESQRPPAGNRHQLPPTAASNSLRTKLLSRRHTARKVKTIPQF